MRSSPRRCSDNDSETTPAAPSLKSLVDSLITPREYWSPIGATVESYQVSPSEPVDMYRRLVGVSRYHPVVSVLLDTSHPNYLELARQSIRNACRRLRPAYRPTDLSL